MNLNEKLIEAELQKFVNNLNFLDVIQFFTSKLFSKLLATESTQEQTDTLQKWKQTSNTLDNNLNSKNIEDIDNNSFNILDYEIFSSNKKTIFIISKFK